MIRADLFGKAMLIWWPLKSRDTPLVSRPARRGGPGYRAATAVGNERGPGHVHVAARRSLFTFTLELPSLGHLDQRCKVRPAAFYDIRSVQL
jgi:hypothetical protein